MARVLFMAAASGVLAMYMPTCVPPAVLPTVPGGQARIAELWEQPADIGGQDLFYGPWGPERAPDPGATYTFIDAYHGWHQELIRGRITPADVRWACELLAKLSDTQWHEAFLAGGYDPAVSARFIRRLQARVREGSALAVTMGEPKS